MPCHLVLTATVHPKGMYVKVADANVRRRQYLEALEFLLAVPGPVIGSITLIENSSADLAPFERVIRNGNPHQRSVELISRSGNDFPPELGIGYGEFRTLDHAVSSSRVLPQSGYIAKLTGRLIVRNLAAILSALEPEFDLAADVTPFPDKNAGWVDTRLMVFSRDFYLRKIQGLYQQVNGSQGVAIEHVVYQMIRQNPGMRLLPRLPREPQWVGYCASTGQRYDTLAMRLKYPPKVLLRAVNRLMRRPSLARLWSRTLNGKN